MNKPNPQDRREHPRLLKNIPLKISGTDFDIVSETKNLSRSGAYCRVSKYLEPMTKLKIHLLLPFKQNNKIITKKVSCDGIVVRTESIVGEEAYNVAIYFSDIQKRGSDTIAEFVNTLLSDGGHAAAG